MDNKGLNTMNLLKCTVNAVAVIKATIVFRFYFNLVNEIANGWIDEGNIVLSSNVSQAVVNASWQHNIHQTDLKLWLSQGMVY